MDYLRSDCILREILEDSKTLTGFLDAIFGFMSRNTDFYHIQNTVADKIGFPRGVKEQILISCMQKYEHCLEQPKFVNNFTVEEPTFVAEEIEIVSEDSYDVANKVEERIIDSNATEMVESSEGSFGPTGTIKFNASDYKNGSVFADYCWSQTLKDVELCILLPKEVKLAKHIKVVFQTNYITIKALHPKEKSIINGETWSKYRHNDVIWSISEGKLVINFDKLQECWWDKLFTNETSIDIKNVDTTRSVTEYSPAIQNSIEKINLQESYHDDGFKTLPLNESEQIARLRRAWDAEGSPFKGQPFDSSVIQFN